MRKGPKGKSHKSNLHPVDRVRVKPERKKLNATERKELKSEAVRLFVGKVGRQAQRGVEPNDRKYNRDVERQFTQLRPQDLDAILREDNEDDSAS